MQNMQAICRFWCYCPILHAICKICKKKYARYAKYASVTFNMQNMHCPLCWWRSCKSFGRVRDVNVFVHIDHFTAISQRSEDGTIMKARTNLLDSEQSWARAQFVSELEPVSRRPPTRSQSPTLNSVAHWQDRCLHRRLGIGERSWIWKPWRRFGNNNARKPPFLFWSFIVSFQI